MICDKCKGAFAVEMQRMRLVFSEMIMAKSEQVIKDLDRVVGLINTDIKPL